jgi:hypothetical protein
MRLDVTSDGLDAAGQRNSSVDDVSKEHADCGFRQADG